MQRELQDLVAPMKTGFLYALVGSIGVAAFTAVVVIVSGDFDETTLRIVASPATIGFAIVCGLACGAYLASERHRVLPLTGISLAIAAAALLLQIRTEADGDGIVREQAVSGPNLAARIALPRNFFDQPTNPAGTDSFQVNGRPEERRGAVASEGQTRAGNRARSAGPERTTPDGSERQMFRASS